MVGQINGRRGNIGFIPVHYLDQSLDFTELVALYRLADVAFITSIRDGMNLVAFEYVATQKGRHGVLVLSEFTGAAQSLAAGAVRINPWNIDEVAVALNEALTMSPAERRSRHDYCFRHVLTHTSERWSDSFLDALAAACQEDEEASAAIPPLLDVGQIVLDFKITGKRRFILMEVMDCLIASRGQRGLAIKRFGSLVQLPQKIREALKVMVADPNLTLVLSSGLPPELMERLFGTLPAILIAHRAASVRARNGEWNYAMTGEAAPWISNVVQAVEWMQKKTPASYIEHTPYSVSWNWEDLQADVGQAHVGGSVFQ